MGDEMHQAHASDHATTDHDRATSHHAATDNGTACDYPAPGHDDPRDNGCYHGPTYDGSAYDRLVSSSLDRATRRAADDIAAAIERAALGSICPPGRGPGA